MTTKITKYLIVLVSLIVLGQSAIRADIVSKVPVIIFVLFKGFADSFQTEVYSGYLNTTSELRKMHYVFVES